MGPWSSPDAARHRTAQDCDSVDCPIVLVYDLGMSICRASLSPDIKTWWIPETSFGERSSRTLTRRSHKIQSDMAIPQIKLRTVTMFGIPETGKQVSPSWNNVLALIAA